MGINMITKLSCLALLLVSMTASAGGSLDDLISGKWILRQYSPRNNELVGEVTLTVNPDKTFRVSVIAFGEPYGWYSGSWKLDNDVITWTREAAGPFPPDSNPVDMDRVESVDNQKLILMSAKYPNPKPQIFERIE